MTGSIRFFGLPRVRTASSSEVIVGASCVFRSGPGSNLIGINRRCILFTDSNARLVIGNGSGFSGTVIGCFDRIILGKNVRCGANTLITDGDWHKGDSRVGPAKPIEIGDNVWLGVDVKVLKGVKIGNNSVIGAGSIVVSDIPANTIAAGNPCRVIRAIETT
jgi:acetyltransferase-like isoleucine patch superfamily enzyme